MYTDKKIGDHVLFTKYTYRPYIDLVDLVNSDEFEKAVLEALAYDEAAADERNSGADEA